MNSDEFEFYVNPNLYNLSPGESPFGEESVEICGLFSMPKIVHIYQQGIIHRTHMFSFIHHKNCQRVNNHFIYQDLLSVNVRLSNAEVRFRDI